ncbi:hypothetical protein ACOBQB_12725 [Streptomyces sp. G5(2025)]|uniref:hypothetical protein n=1 Tax=Streptomyces sp. G5(2025) TaxID=3406628 RepID=UPI003C295048
MRELRNCGYYRVITERLSDGRLIRITEVYDTAQDWAAEEYARQVVRRVERRLKAEAEQSPQALEDEGAETEDGFSGVGSPGVGEPAAGSSGFLVSNHTNYPQQNPPSPAAVAPGAPVEAVGSSGREGSGCAAHADQPGRRCRDCGTSPRKQREAQQQAEKEKVKASRREANERVLKSVRRQPDAQGLSAVARQRLEEIRQAQAREKADRNPDAPIQVALFGLAAYREQADSAAIEKNLREAETAGNRVDPPTYLLRIDRSVPQRRLNSRLPHALR